MSKAYIKPLNGKYYGTVVAYQVNINSGWHEIEIWNTDNSEPSQREIELRRYEY